MTNINNQPPAAEEPRPALWQPIETAPKDGTRILLFLPKPSSGGDSEIGLGHWDDEEGYEAWRDDALERFESPQPTHWMALPPAPESTHEHQSPHGDKPEPTPPAAEEPRPDPPGCRICGTTLCVGWSFSVGPFCREHWDAIKASVEALREFDAGASVPLPASSPAQQEIDATWKAIERGWLIEPRAYFEAEAPKNGFQYPLAQAIHHIWKRHRIELPEWSAASSPAVERLPATWRTRATALTDDREVMRDDRVKARAIRECAEELDAALRRPVSPLPQEQK